MRGRIQVSHICTALPSLTLSQSWFKDEAINATMTFQCTSYCWVLKQLLCFLSCIFVSVWRLKWSSLLVSTKSRYRGWCTSTPQIVFRETENLPMEILFSPVTMRHRLSGSCPSRNSTQTPKIMLAPGRWHLSKKTWGRKVTFSLRPSIMDPSAEFKNKKIKKINHKSPQAL